MRMLVYIIAIFCVSFSSMAFALDYGQILKDGDCPLQDDLGPKIPPVPAQNGCDARDRAPLTLGLAVYHALLVSVPGDKDEEKFHRGELAMAVKNNPKFIPNAEDITIIKRQVSKVYGPLVTYLVYRLIDPGLAASPK